jgi:long-chain fatty acid transport protein
MASGRLFQPTVALFLLAPGVAAAGGFSTARFGGERGTAVGDQPTAIYYNPAALALGSGTRIYLEGFVAVRTGSYERPAAAIDNALDEGEEGAGTPPDGVAANTGKATIGNLAVSPFLGVASDLGIENLDVGVAFFVPFGGQSNWDKVDVLADDDRFPGAVDGAQRWATITGELRALYVSAAGAYHFPAAHLSLGASVSFVRQQVDTLRARTAAGTDDLVAGDTILEGRSRINVAGNSIAAALGVMWQPTANVWIGASCQSQPGFGESKLKGELTNKFGAGASNTSDVELRQALPDIARIGLRWQPLARIEVRLAADWQRWSRFARQCLLDAENPDRNCDLMDDGSQGPDAEGIVVNIPRHWRDTFGVRAGASYWLSPRLELGGGASFDSSAVRNRYLDPALMDMNKVILHAGARYALLEQLTLTLALNNVFYFTREVEPRSPNAAGETDGFRAPSRTPDFAGTYHLNAFYANIGAEYAF